MVRMRDARRLSGLVVARCGDSPRLRACWPWAPLRRGVCRLAVWLELVGGLGVAGTGQRAVLCLTPPRRRDKARLFGVVGAVGLAGGGVVVVGAVTWWPLVVPAGAMWAVVMLCTLRCWWRFREGESALGRVRPSGGWSLHNFAGDPRYPGAGRELLEAVCHQADALGRVLYLDATAARLVAYYRSFGFEERAHVRLPTVPPLTVHRMIREPVSPPTSPPTCLG